ncbi:MAG: hypothetical protein IBX64_08795 [Actinobacteria bacterium]|nr:hypothetical protein [Actinomycetota bacterium]
MQVDKQIYDVIIAGAGPAGCVVAHYLPGDFNIEVELKREPERMIIISRYLIGVMVQDL